MEKSFKILIVDDDEIFILLHTYTLKDSGLLSESLGFENAPDALDYLNQHQELHESYLILLDINMAVMNGWQFLDEIQTAPYADRLFVVMVTSSIEWTDRMRAQQYPQVIDYFEKPLSIENCRQVMKKLGIQSQTSAD